MRQLLALQSAYPGGLLFPPQDKPHGYITRVKWIADFGCP